MRRSTLQTTLLLLLVPLACLASAQDPLDHLRAEFVLSESKLREGDVAIVQLTLTNRGTKELAFDCAANIAHHFEAQFPGTTTMHSLIIGSGHDPESMGHMSTIAVIEPKQQLRMLVMIRVLGTKPMRHIEKEIRHTEVDVIFGVPDLDPDPAEPRVMGRYWGERIRVPVDGDVRAADSDVSLAWLESQVHGGFQYRATDRKEITQMTFIPGMLVVPDFPLPQHGLLSWGQLRAELRDDSCLARLIDHSAAIDGLLAGSDTGNMLAKQIYSVLSESPPIERRWILPQLYSRMDGVAEDELRRVATKEGVEDGIKTIY